MAKAKKKVKYFEIYIKSHCEAPDYEDWCKAESKEEASRIFAYKLNRLFNYDEFCGEKDLLDNIREFKN